MKLFSPLTRSCLLIVVTLLISSGFLSAQVSKQYLPRKTHSALSEELIVQLETRFEEENKSMEGSREIRQINMNRKNAFLEKLVDGEFIKDDSLETYVNRVLNKIVSSNVLATHSRHVLILESPHMNAVCYGQGIYFITVGLLGRIENENQLAFILAHEIAHDQLGHIRTRIVQEADLNLDEKAREQTFKIFSGKLVTKEIEEFRSLIYDVSKHSRNNEMLADSMAFVLLSKAQYNQQKAFSALDVLQSARSPKQEIGAELFLPFNSSSYPFQDYWLNDRLSVFSKRYYGTFLYAADSIESHPTIELRKEALLPYLNNISEEKNNQPVDFVKAVTETAEFETAESAYKNKEYDLSLYYALQLFRRYPRNSYLISRIGKILVDLYEARNSNKFDQYVAKYTLNYSDEAKLINNFLYNLTTKELGELAFHFLSTNSNLYPSDKSQYYLLWKISSLTYRNDTRDQTRDSFKKKFNTGINSYSYK